LKAFVHIFPQLKVHNKWKIICAYMKGLSKYRRMAFFFLNYLFSFWRYWLFFSIMQIRSAMRSYCLQLHVKSGKYWINDISENIEAVFFKLCTVNVHYKRNKMTPLMLLPWQQFYRLCCVSKNRNSLFSLKAKTMYPLCLTFKVASGDIEFFDKERLEPK